MVPLFSNLFILQRTESEIRIDCLMKKLAEANSAHCATKGTSNGDRNVGTREAEAILVIKRLQEQVTQSFVLLSLSHSVFFIVLFILENNIYLML